MPDLLLIQQRIIFRIWLIAESESAMLMVTQMPADSGIVLIFLVYHANDTSLYENSAWGY